MMSGGDCGKALLPEIAHVVEEWVCGQRHLTALWPSIERTISDLIAGDDPRFRRQTLYFRIWRAFAQPSSPQCRDDFGKLDSLSFESLQTTAATTDPRLEAMIASELSDQWLVRGFHDRAIGHALEACRWAGTSGNATLVANRLASLGFALTTAGHVDEGIGLTTRAASTCVDSLRIEFGGDGWTARPQWRTVEELADAYEHTHNFRRALVAYETVISMLGPGSSYNRALLQWSTTRCLAALGRSEQAVNALGSAPPRASWPVTNNATVKHARAAAGAMFSGGDPSTALATCVTAANDLSGPDTIELRREVLLDGARMAHQIDEPHWILDHLGGAEFTDRAPITLKSTFAARELAWAYRRVGNRADARHYADLAAAGERRFHRRVGWPRFRACPIPAGLLIEREQQRRVARARHLERRSLHRAIDTFANDIRTQLASLELLSEMIPQRPTALSPIVASVDALLENLIRAVEADRQIGQINVPLHLLVERVVESFRERAATKQIDIVSTIRPGLLVICDPTRLSRIVSNLVSNAVKFSPVGGEILIRSDSADRSAVDLHIIDSGPGAAVEEADAIFAWGGTGSTKPSAGETQRGIGLFAAQHLARQLGTTLRFQPRNQDRPSAFSIRLTQGTAL